VPESAAFLVEVAPSPRARRARMLAVVLTAAACCACLAALLLAPSVARAAALLVSLVALGLSFRPGQNGPARRLRMASDGTLTTAIEGEYEPATVRYCAPSYICLGGASGPLSVWPESMPASAWRRLLVACRWTGGSDANGGRATAGPRTK
jgi:hypothetical protein